MNKETLIFIIRIKGILGLDPKSRKILHLLRLYKINSGVFAKLNIPCSNLIRHVEMNITYGYPCFQITQKLISKRGHTMVNGHRIPLTSSNIIDSSLKKFNIVCLNDLIHTIYTLGPNFKAANRFMCSF